MTRAKLHQNWYSIRGCTPGLKTKVISSLWTLYDMNRLVAQSTIQCSNSQSMQCNQVPMWLTSNSGRDEMTFLSLCLVWWSFRSCLRSFHYSLSFIASILCQPIALLCFCFLSWKFSFGWVLATNWRFNKTVCDRGMNGIRVSDQVVTNNEWSMDGPWFLWSQVGLMLVVWITFWTISRPFFFRKLGKGGGQGATEDRWHMTTGRATSAIRTVPTTNTTPRKKIAESIAENIC